MELELLFSPSEPARTDGLDNAIGSQTTIRIYWVVENEQSMWIHPSRGRGYISHKVSQRLAEDIDVVILPTINCNIIVQSLRFFSKHGWTLSVIGEHYRMKIYFLTEVVQKLSYGSMLLITLRTWPSWYLEVRLPTNMVPATRRKPRELETCFDFTQCGLPYWSFKSSEYSYPLRWCENWTTAHVTSNEVHKPKKTPFLSISTNRHASEFFHSFPVYTYNTHTHIQFFSPSTRLPCSQFHKSLDSFPHKATQNKPMISFHT